LAASAKSVSQQGLSDAVIVEIDSSADEVGNTVGQLIRIHPFGALFILTQPLHVIVEDETSDGGFILWVARALGIDAIIKAYRSGALVFRHAGGKGQLRKSAVSLSFGVWPRDTQPIRSMQLRAAAILDSDARFQGDTPNEEIRAALSSHVAFTHVLARRTIENYVPAKYFRDRMGQSERNRVDAFFRLTDPQQRHFPIKRGFRDDAGVAPTLAEFAAKPGRPVGEVALFGGIPPADWVLINVGFGDGVGAVFTDTRFRCEPNSRGLFDRTDTQELGGLMGRIVRHL
jgi:hypothetical protein